MIILPNVSQKGIIMQKEGLDNSVLCLAKQGKVALLDGKLYGKVNSLGTRRELGSRHPNGDIMLSFLADGQKMIQPYYCRVVWLLSNGKIPNGHIVSHKNGEKGNNELDNLQLEEYCRDYNHPQRWSAEDVSWLESNYLIQSLPEMSKHLNRSTKAIRQKLRVLSAPQKRGAWALWTEEEDKMLTELYIQKKKVNEVANILGRSVNSVRLRANRILNAYRSDKHLQLHFRSENFYLSLKAKITRNTAGAKCCLCNYFKHIDLHHIDGDRKNNAIDNIASLCPNHHREVEAGEHPNEKLYCVWWRVYSDGSTTDKMDNRKEIKIRRCQNE